jgi:hypothetical protein
MQGSIALKFAAVIALLVATFFAGRASIKAPDPEPVESAAPPRPAEKLSALTRSDPKIAPVNDPFNHSPDGPASDPSDLAASADVAVVASILAEAANHINDVEALGVVLSSWLESDPDTAIAWLTSGERSEETLRTLFSLWGSDDPDAALAWLAANQNLEGYDSAAVALALGLAHQGSAESALALADSVTKRISRVQIWMDAGADLYSANQDELRERLASTDIPEDLQAFMIENWRENISNAAKRNAQNLASVYSSARAAGATFQGKSAIEIAEELTAGIFGGGSFSTTKFQIPGLSETDINRALRNLVFESDNGSLSYGASEQDDL